MSEEVLLERTVLPTICASFDLKELSLFRKALKVERLNCSFSVTDQNNHTIRFSEVTDLTTTLAYFVQKFTANRTLLLLADRDLDAYRPEISDIYQIGPYSPKMLKSIGYEQEAYIYPREIRDLVGANPVDPEFESAHDRLIPFSLSEYQQMIKMLVQSGVDINFEKHSGSLRKSNTALMTAIEENDLVMAELLLSLGADPKLTVKQNRESALARAVKKGFLEMVKLLLKYRADVNQIDLHGETPLFMAVRKGYFEIVKLLVNAGADINRINVYEDDLVFIAESNNHPEIVEYLRSVQ